MWINRFILIRLKVLLVTIGISLSWNTYAQNYDLVRIKSDFADSIVKIRTSYLSTAGTTKTIEGTAFIVGRLGYALTNQHVIFASDFEKLHSITGHNKGNSIGVIRVIKTDEELDLALILLPTSSSWPGLRVGDSNSIQDGEDVFKLGFPVGNNTVTGNKSSITNLNTIINGWFQTDLRLNHGESGSPLFNKKGEVIGVVVGKHPTLDGFGFAIPINYAKILLQLTSENF